MTKTPTKRRKQKTKRSKDDSNDDEPVYLITQDQYEKFEKVYYDYIESFLPQEPILSHRTIGKKLRLEWMKKLGIPPQCKNDLEAHIRYLQNRPPPASVAIVNKWYRNFIAEKRCVEHPPVSDFGGFKELADRLCVTPAHLSNVLYHLRQTPISLGDTVCVDCDDATSDGLEFIKSLRNKELGKIPQSTEPITVDDPVRVVIVENCVVVCETTVKMGVLFNAEASRKSIAIDTSSYDCYYFDNNTETLHQIGRAIAFTDPSRNGPQFKTIPLYLLCIKK